MKNSVKILQTLVLTHFLLSLSACAIGGAKEESCESSCEMAYHGADHGHGEVHTESFNAKKVSQYRNFYFSDISPQEAVQFLKDHDIDLVVDISPVSRAGDLAQDYPAVYWHFSLKGQDDLSQEKYDGYYEHINLFSGKKILFTGNDINLVTSLFVHYWAEKHALNEKTEDDLVGKLDIKDTAWLQHLRALAATPDEAGEERQPSSLPENQVAE